MPLIILDRDGVINYDSADFIRSPDEWIAIPGSLKAIARLNHADYQVAVASNQSGLARGHFDLVTLDQIHEKMRKELAQIGGKIDVIVFCPHGPDDNCTCRKPKPGLLLDLAEKFQCDLAGVPVVGDSLRDVEVALAAGAQPILVRSGKELPDCLPAEVPIYNDLAAVVAALLDNAS